MGLLHIVINCSFFFTTGSEYYLNFDRFTSMVLMHFDDFSFSNPTNNRTAYGDASLRHYSLGSPPKFPI